MILTYKVKYSRDLSAELAKGRQVALFALKTKSRSSKDVKHIGLKSAIANQILKKYSSNKKLKRVSSVKLTVPSQSIKFEKGRIKIPCLKLEIDFQKNIEKINQIELDQEYAYISCTIKEAEKMVVQHCFCKFNIDIPLLYPRNGFGNELKRELGIQTALAVGIVNCSYRAFRFPIKA
ncbi:MAG: hypothetical protein WDZ28_03260 [Simkaniaceae bacterium]